ncbi:hypothetical protein [Methylobacter sp. sgz302048]|uniref:hypothetical protein n=1 Tax=Methylobacter sp. sgz302048 TaxID=3455945 RepID=UPI003F9F3AC0
MTHNHRPPKNPGRFRTLVDDIGKYANSLNLSQEDMRAVLLNPTYVHVINKARMYDELMAKQNVAAKKVQNVPPRVLQPENETTTERDNFNKRKSAAIRSGDDRAIAALMAELL